LGEVLKEVFKGFKSLKVILKPFLGRIRQLKQGNELNGQYIEARK
jgi:hypothetical protein